MEPATSRTTVQMVVLLLGLVALTCVVGAIVLSYRDKAAPGELWTLAGTTSGALGALLVSTRSVPPLVPENPPPPGAAAVMPEIVDSP